MSVEGMQNRLPRTVRSWKSKAVWGKLSGLLAASVHDDFERKVLPFLRFLWPSIRQAPRMKKWDQQGIDLFVWTDEGPFPCAVQCKGFEVQTLDRSQIEQVRSSIKTFRNSDYTAEVYILLHNRSGENRSFAEEVEKELKLLVDEGKARQAFLWDRERFLNHFFSAVEEALASSLRRHSEQVLKAVQKLFAFGSVHLDQVPVTHSRVIFNKFDDCQIQLVGRYENYRTTEILPDSRDSNWTILTGHFGMGKTMSVLASALSSEQPVIYVSCVSLPSSIFKAGNTSGLTQEIIRRLDLLESDHIEEYQLLVEASGAVLHSLLRREDSPYVFLLDGLDEHHFFSQLKGLQSLVNQVQDFSASVVLTTRSEHLDSLFGDFNTALGGMARKCGNQFEAKLLNLEKWSSNQTLEAIEQALGPASSVTSEASHRLLALRDSIQNETAVSHYGDLLRHPLFLHFILEDVAEHGLQQKNRAELIGSWIKRKIRRDRSSWTYDLTPYKRVHPFKEMDTDEAIDGAIRAMEEVAYQMVDRTATSYTLLETTEKSEVEAIFRKELRNLHASILEIVLNSLLTPQGKKRELRTRISFCLRIVQEYLLASRLVRTETPGDLYPQSIRSLVTDIKQIRFDQ